MNLLTSIFTVVHLVAAIAIVVLVLLQQGKGADMGAAFGEDLPAPCLAVGAQRPS